MKKILYAILGIAVLVLVFSDETRQSLMQVFRVGEKSAVRMLEDSADSGELALEKYNSIYNKKAKQLEILISYKKDAQRAAQEMAAKAAAAREQGDEQLALRIEQDQEWYTTETSKYDARILKLGEQLKQFAKVRDRARQDVALVRQRLSFARSAKRALEDTGEDEELQRAEELVNNLHSSLNKLEAETEVLNMVE